MDGFSSLDRVVVVAERIEAVRAPEIAETGDSQAVRSPRFVEESEAIALRPPEIAETSDGEAARAPRFAKMSKTRAVACLGLLNPAALGRYHRSRSPEPATPGRSHRPLSPKPAGSSGRPACCRRNGRGGVVLPLPRRVSTPTRARGAGSQARSRRCDSTSCRAATP